MKTSREIAKQIIQMEIESGKILTFNQKVIDSKVSYNGVTFEVEDNFLSEYIDMIDEVADYDADENFMSKEPREVQYNKLSTFLNTL